MDDDLIEMTKQQWLSNSHSKGLVVLVATDPCYQDLGIFNATMVIHYDIPTKTRFGNRLACMVDKFEDRMSSYKPEESAVSYIMLTEAVEHVQYIYQFLQRSGATYPQELDDFVEGYSLGTDKDPEKYLCPSLKSFGSCQNQERSCEHRHILIPEVDLRTGEVPTDCNLLSSGEVKIRVIHVVNSSRFYCHVLEHHSIEDGVKTDLKLPLQVLNLELSLFFSKESNHFPYVPSDNLSDEGLCGFKESTGVVYRAKVLKVRKGTVSHPQKQCKVWLVDAGTYKCGTIDQLVKLPQELAEVPYQAMEVYVCRVKPVDDDFEWTDKSDMFVNAMVDEKDLIGRIVLRLGTTLWLDPLVHRVQLKKVGTATDFVIRQELINNKFAMDNPNHIMCLYELCRGKTDIPEAIMRRYFDYCLEIELMQESLPPDQQTHAVNIAAVINPGLFYIQKWENISAMDELDARVQDKMAGDDYHDNSNAGAAKADSNVSLGVGDVCLAKSMDTKWYRSKIITACSDDQWEVYFLDYGDKEVVSKSNIQPLSREFSQLPCQAIECRLAYIQPKENEEWDGKSIDVLCDISHDVDGEKKKLYAQVLSKEDASYSMAQKLVVNIFDANADNIKFSEQLVWRHVAVCCDKESGIQNLIGKPALMNQLFFNPLDKVPFLCGNIYWSEDSASSLSQAHELSSLLSERSEGWDNVMEQRDVLPTVIKVIGFLQDEESHGVIVKALTKCCCDSSRVCSIAVESDLVFTLALCLEQFSRPRFQLQAAEAVSSLVHQEIFRDSCEESPLLSILFDFFKSHERESLDAQVLQFLCTSSAVLLHNSQESDCSLLKSREMLNLISSYLVKDARDENCLDVWLELLAAIASCGETHAIIMKESFIKPLVKLIAEVTTPKAISSLLSVYQSLIQASKRHKTALLEHKLFPTIRKVLDRDLVSPVQEQCQKVYQALDLSLPAPERLAGALVQVEESVQKTITPEVRWAENCFKVLLTVKVRNASEDHFSILPDRIVCRSTSEGVRYVLDWQLYDSIIPEKSQIVVKASNTILSLRKNIKGKWGRLLKEKIKPPNLFLDFDKAYDSDEDEDVDVSQDVTKLSQKKGGFKGIDPKLRLPPRSSTEEEESDGLAVYSNHESDGM